MSPSKLKKIQIVGKVVTEVENKTSRESGKPFCRFCVIDDKSRKTYAVLGFKNLSGLTPEKLPIGERVSIAGGLSSTDDGTVFADVVTSLDSKPTEPTKSWQQYQQDIKLAEDVYLAAGFRKVTDSLGVRWLHEADCIMADGRWQAKIEYIMDKLGASEVTKRIREYVTPSVPTKALTKFQNDKYMALREQLLDEALLS